MFFFLNIDLACVLPIFAGLLGAFILGWLLRHLFFDNNRLALLQEENKNLKYEHDFEMSKKNANYSSLENKHFDLKYSFSKANEEVGEAHKKIQALSSALEAEKLKPPIEKIVEVPKEIIVEDFEKINHLKSELDLHKQMLEEERSKPPKEVVVEKLYENLERVNHLQSELDLHKYLLEEERSKPPKEVVVEKPYENLERINQLQSELDLHKYLLEEERSKPPKEVVVEKPYEDLERVNQLQSELDLHKYLLEEERSKPPKEVVVEKPYENLERVNQLQSELDLHKQMLNEERSKPAKEVIVEKPFENVERINQLETELAHYRQLLDIELSKSSKEQPSQTTMDEHAVFVKLPSKETVEQLSTAHAVETIEEQVEPTPQNSIIGEESMNHEILEDTQNHFQENPETDNIPMDLVQPYSVFFSPDEKDYALGDILKNYLDRAETYLSHHPEKKLLVIGYTDNIGGIEENRLLSEERASFIKSEFSLLGLDANRIETLGRGMIDPLGDNESEEGRSKNRRVTIQII